MKYFAQIPQNRFFFFLSIILILLLGLISSQEKPVSVTYGSNINGMEHVESVNSEEISTLRIGTYNIHQGKNIDGVDTLDSMIQVLKASRLHFIGLNEVSDGIFGYSNNAMEIAEDLDMGWLFAPTREKNFQSNYGNALLSKIPLVDYKIQPLVYQMNDQDQLLESDTHRNVIISTLNIKDKNFTLISTHLDRGVLREEQLKAVLAIFEMYSPAILIGDLNTDYNNDLIKAGLEKGVFDDALSNEDINNEERIDCILIRGFKVVQTGMFPAGPSDHPHYWAELSF